MDASHLDIAAGTLLLSDLAAPQLNCLDNGYQKHPFRSQIGTPTREDWNKHRQTITRLYRDEKRTLKNVMHMMKNELGFRGTSKMFKLKISEWDIRKNLSWSEREAVCQSLAEKQVIWEQDAKIVVRGQERTLTLFHRHLQRSRRSMGKAIESSQNGGRTSAMGPAIDPCLDNTGSHVLESFAAKLTMRSPMYPSGDERGVEIICGQVSTLCESPLPGWPTKDLFYPLKASLTSACRGRYAEARTYLNRAEDRFYQSLRTSPHWALISWLYCEALGLRNTANHFDILKIFRTHALELSCTVYGKYHPATVVLTQLDRLHHPSDASSPAHLAAMATLRQSSPNQGRILSAQLCFNLVDHMEGLGESQEAELILLRMIRRQENIATFDDESTYDSGLIMGAAVCKLAGYYAQFFPEKYDEVASLYSQLCVAPGALGVEELRSCLNFSTLKGKARRAQARGDLVLATHYQRQCLAIALDQWGEDPLDVMSVTGQLADLLEQQSMAQEAEDIRKLYGLTV